MINRKIVLFLLITVFMILPSSAYTCDVWKFMGNAPWQNPSWSASGQLFVIGNTLYEYNGRYNSTWKSTDGITWELINSSIAVGARQEGFSSAEFNDRMWVFGGGTFNGVIQNITDLWNSTDGNIWYLVNDSVFHQPIDRIVPGMIEFNGKLWLLGGYNISSSWFPFTYSSLNDTWYSDDGINWHRSNASAAWPARSWFNVISTGSRLWIVGGWASTSGLGISYNDTWYSDDGDLWYPGNLTPEFPRVGSPSVAYFDNKLWFTGGGQKALYSSTDGIVWKMVNASPEYGQIQYAKMVAFDGKLLIYTNNVYLNGGYRTKNFIYACEETLPAEATCTDATMSDVATEASSSVQDIFIIGIVMAAMAVVVVVVARLLGVNQ